MIERLIRRRDLRDQFHFAGEATSLVGEREDVVAAKSHRGLHLLARREPDLAAPLRLLRAVYGPVEVRPAGRDNPIIEVRIGLELRDLPGVRVALERRGANSSEEYAGVHCCVLRFEAPPDRLFGLPRELAQLVRGALTQQMIVRRYGALRPRIAAAQDRALVVRPG